MSFPYPPAPTIRTRLSRRLILLIVIVFILTVLLPLAPTTTPAYAGSPIFATRRSFGTGSDNTTSVAVGDIDGDGDLDLITGNYHEQSMVYLNDGAGNFTTTLPFGTGTETILSVAVGDVNGDGRLDIIAGTDAQEVTFLNNGTDSLSFDSGHSFGTGIDDTQSVAVGDVNGDGHLDIVAGNMHTQNLVYLNDGTGQFYNGPATCASTPRVRCFGTGTDPSDSVAIGDVDNDGDLDIITGNLGQQSVVYLNDGANPPSFDVPRPFGVPNVTRSVAVGDVNGDGALDIVAGNSGPDLIVVYLNDGAGNFPTSRIFAGGPDHTLSVAVGDVDGDGDLDIVTGNFNVSTLSSGQDLVYLNDGTGDFSTVQPFGIGVDNTASVALGDVDADGALDIIVGNIRQQNAVYLNDGAGSFPVGKSFGTGTDATFSLAVGDMNDDGALDLIAGNFSQQSVIYLNDGAGSFSTLRPFGGPTEGTRSVAVGDVNGDGTLDIAVGAYGQNVIYLNNGANQPSFNQSLNFGTGTDFTNSVAFGDVDADGDLDIVVGNTGQSVVYLNDGSGNFSMARSFGTGTDDTWSVALGDVDGDGDLDIVSGNRKEQSVVYLNDGATPPSFDEARNFGTASDDTTSVAVGDMNGDGHLDIVAGNYQQQNVVYLNDGTGHFTERHHFGTGIDGTRSVAVGDVDGNGDLDLITGNYQQQSAVYLNDGTGMFVIGRLFGNATDTTASVTVGDMDRDGALDVVAGNLGGQNAVYLNRLVKSAQLANTPPHVILTRPGRTPDAGFSSAPEIISTQVISIPYTLLDRDGDPVRDIRAFYSLNGGGQWRPARGTSTTPTTNLSATPIDDERPFNWIDISSTGTPVPLGNDAFAGPFDLGFTFRNFDQTYNQFWISSNGWLSLDAPSAAVPNNICLPNATAPKALIAPFWDDLDPSAGGTPHVLYRQVDPDTLVVEYYQVPRSGGGGTYTFEVILWRDGSIAFQYLTMAGTLDSATVGVQNSIGNESIQVVCNKLHIHDAHAIGIEPQGQRHIFQWDTFASGFFGQSDNVVFRIEAYPSQGTTGPYQRPYLAAQTFSFRVRGTQIRVVSDTQPNGIAHAIVYRLPKGQAGGAQPIPGPDGQPVHTNVLGYLPGQGELEPGDQLAALLPISATNTYTMYYTSAAPTDAGMALQPVTTPGVQILTVSRANPLILFNLDVSLEWDARRDTQFLNQLRTDLRRASELLFDWTNGQAALGRVTVYQDRAHWNDAHMRIYATNRMRPNAVKGGIVTTAISETVAINGSAKTITYGPGQVRMGAIWNRYGDASANLGEDWPRALAHELGHFALFLDDNYIGLDGTGTLISVASCPGAMADPYRDDYSEFHPDAGWEQQCHSTLSNGETGRSDWATIKAIYDARALNFSLHHPATFDSHPGPVTLPLAVTQVAIVAPQEPTRTLDAPIFFLTHQTALGSERVLPGPGARAFLFQDDRLIDLGSPTQDQVLARGAQVAQGGQPADRLCVYDPSYHRQGCREVSATDLQVRLFDQPGWQPDIAITPVTSTTLRINVTDVSADLSLKARLYPANGSASAEIDLMAEQSAYTGTFIRPPNSPSFEGYIHVWVDEAETAGTRREAIVDYLMGGNPGERWGHDAPRGNPGERWGHDAPVLSSDGQAILFAQDAAFDEGKFFVLQATSVRQAPSWATPVGHAYRLTTTSGISLANMSINIGYLGNEVPHGVAEEDIRVYFWSETDQRWKPLVTRLDIARNEASARVQGPGMYALMASTAVPLFGPGWNSFPYLARIPQPVGEALASIERKYTIVYTSIPTDTADTWKVYGPDVPAEWAPLVNDLTKLQYNHTYLIHATESITLYLQAGSASSAAGLTKTSIVDLTVPPATYYGMVPGVASNANLTVQAWVNGNLCGQARTQPYTIAGEPRAVFVIDVRHIGAGVTAGCGTPGQLVTFSFLDGAQEVKSIQLPWDNRRVNAIWTNLVYLPLVRR